MNTLFDPTPYRPENPEPQKRICVKVSSKHAEPKNGRANSETPHSLSPLLPAPCVNLQDVKDATKTKLSADELRKITLNSVDKWSEENKSQRVAKNKNALKILLEGAEYNIAQLTDEIIRRVYKKRGWSERNIWPKTALNHFKGYLRERGDFPFNTGTRPNCNVIPESAKINEEIESFCTKHKIGQSGRKPGIDYIRDHKRLVQSMRVYILKKHSHRRIESMADFTEEDAKETINYMETEEASIITGKKIKSCTWSGQGIELNFIFKTASKYGLYGIKNIFASCALKKYLPRRREKTFTCEDIEKLRSLNLNKYASMSIEDRFKQDMANTAISAAYEAALRSADLKLLCWESFEDSAIVPHQILHLKIYHGKHRESWEYDTIPFYFTRLKPDLTRWETTSRAYCKKYNLKPTIKINDEIYHPVFFNENGGPISETYLTNVVKKQCGLTKIILKKGEAAHVLRHTRLTELSVKGMPRNLLKVFSRHKKIDMLDIYCHEDLDAATHWLRQNPCSASPYTHPQSTSLSHPADKTYSIQDLRRLFQWTKNKTWSFVKKLQQLNLLPISVNNGKFLVQQADINRFTEKYVKLREAAALSPKNKNYLAQMCREQPHMFKPIKIGDIWYVERKSFMEWLINLKHNA